jgi:hypothetical protein
VPTAAHLGPRIFASNLFWIRGNSESRASAHSGMDRMRRCALGILSKEDRVPERDPLFDDQSDSPPREQRGRAIAQPELRAA